MLSRWHSHTMQALAAKPMPIPDDGLVYWHPLAEALTTLPTGQSVTQSGEWTYGVVNRVPCATKASGSATIAMATAAGIPVGTADRTLSVWLARLNSSTLNYCGWGSVSATYGWGYRQSAGRVYFPPYTGGDGYEPDIGAWHHYAATYAAGIVAWYIDGRLQGTSAENVNTTAIRASTPVYVGRATTHNAFCVSSMRIYNRALDGTEILALAREFRPSAP